MMRTKYKFRFVFYMENAFFIGFGGFGDILTYNGMIRYYANLYNNINVILGSNSHLAVAKYMYRDNKKINIVSHEEYEIIKNKNICTYDTIIAHWDNETQCEKMKLKS